MKNNIFKKLFPILIGFILGTFASDLIGFFFLNGDFEYSTQVYAVITVLVLLLYAFDTNRIANQTIENNLRPVILRVGYIRSWEDVVFDLSTGKLDVSQSKLIRFQVQKNIAKDLEGYFTLNNKRFPLLFVSEISKISETGDGGANFYFNKKWGWVNTGVEIFAIYDPSCFAESPDEDGLYLTYSDIEGNRYFTREGKNFSQESGRL